MEDNEERGRRTLKIFLVSREKDVVYDKELDWFTQTVTLLHGQFREGNFEFVYRSVSTVRGFCKIIRDNGRDEE